jgi:hypothetical protein
MFKVKYQRLLENTTKRGREREEGGGKILNCEVRYQSYFDY